MSPSIHAAAHNLTCQAVPRAVDLNFWNEPRRLLLTRRLACGSRRGPTRESNRRDTRASGAAPSVAMLGLATRSERVRLHVTRPGISCRPPLARRPVRRSARTALVSGRRAFAPFKSGSLMCVRRLSPVPHIVSPRPWQGVPMPGTIRRLSMQSQPGTPSETRRDLDSGGRSRIHGQTSTSRRGAR